MDDGLNQKKRELWAEKHAILRGPIMNQTFKVEEVPAQPEGSMHALLEEIVRQMVNFEPRSRRLATEKSSDD